MLTVTDSAATAIRDLVEGPALPDGAGLRIFTTDEVGADLAVITAGAPRDGDRVVEKAGARVFLESEAAVLLRDQVLDAELDAAGKGWTFTCHAARPAGDADA
jgi:Fe-S cluster assembly iron-binding protein IscA